MIRSVDQGLVIKLTPMTTKIIPATCRGDEGSASKTIARIIVNTGPADPMIVVRVAPNRTIASLIMKLGNTVHTDARINP